MSVEPILLNVRLGEIISLQHVAWDKNLWGFVEAFSFVKKNWIEIEIYHCIGCSVSSCWGFMGFVTSAGRLINFTRNYKETCWDFVWMQCIRLSLWCKRYLLSRIKYELFDQILCSGKMEMFSTKNENIFVRHQLKRNPLWHVNECDNVENFFDRCLPKFIRTAVFAQTTFAFVANIEGGMGSDVGTSFTISAPLFANNEKRVS